MRKTREVKANAPTATGNPRRRRSGEISCVRAPPPADNACMGRRLKFGFLAGFALAALAAYVYIERETWFPPTPFTFAKPLSHAAYIDTVFYPGYRTANLCFHALFKKILALRPAVYASAVVGIAVTGLLGGAALALIAAVLPRRREK